MTQHSSSQKHTITIGMAIPIIAALAFTIYAFKTDQPITKATFEFSPLEIDEAKLISERAKKVSKRPVPIERKKQLLKAARDANAQQFGTDITAKDAREVGTILQFAADDVMESGGLEGFMETGEALFTACASAVESVRVKLDAKTSVRDVSMLDDSEAYRQNCGDLLPLLIEHRIMKPDGSWTNNDGPVLTKLLNRIRWAFTVHTHTPYYEQLTPYESEIYHRWRIEAPDAFPLTKRLEFAEAALVILPKYDGRSAMANLLVSEDNLAAAFKTLSNAPSTPAVKKKLRWLKQRLETNTNASKDSN